MPRLPRGPSRLTPEQTAANQRERLIDAMLELIETQGYLATPVADVLRLARVSRRSFYEFFADRDELLKAAFETSANVALDGARASIAGLQQGDSLEALVNSLCNVGEEERGMLALWSVEISAARLDGYELRKALMGDYAGLIRNCLSSNGDRPLPMTMTATLAGALHREIDAKLRDTTFRGSGLQDFASHLARWIETYHPVPFEIQDGLETPGAWIGSSVLLGGRAPGTLTLAPDGFVPRIGRTSVGFRGHANRERILDAVAQIDAEEGYGALTTQAIVRRAEVPLSAFNAQFSDRDACFMAALEVGHLKGQAIVARARESASSWQEGVQRSVHAFFEFLASEPAFASLALVDAPFARPATARRHNEHATAYAELMLDGGSRRDGRFAIASECVIHWLFELAYDYAMTGRIDELPRATSVATYVALVPFIGPAAAARAALDTDELAKP